MPRNWKSHYDCRTITDEEMKELEFSWDAVVITNAHLVLKKPELVQELRKIKGDEYQLILVSPLIPNYMFEKFNQVLQMDLPYYRQTYSFGNTIFYKQFTTKLRLLYLFGNIVRRVNMTEGIIVMYCSASAKKFLRLLFHSSDAILSYFWTLTMMIQKRLHQKYSWWFITGTSFHTCLL